jgi:hypothetical protein
MNCFKFKNKPPQYKETLNKKDIEKYFIIKSLEIIDNVGGIKITKKDKKKLFSNQIFKMIFDSYIDKIYIFYKENKILPDEKYFTEELNIENLYLLCVIILGKNRMIDTDISIWLLETFT